MSKKMREKITDIVTFIYLAIFIIWIVSLIFGKIQVSSVAVIWLLGMTGIFFTGRGIFQIYQARKIRRGHVVKGKIDSLVYWNKFSGAPVFLFFYEGQKMKKDSIRKHRVFSEKKLLGTEMEIYYNPDYPEKVTFGKAGSELALNILWTLAGVGILILTGVLMGTYFTG